MADLLWKPSLTSVFHSSPSPSTCQKRLWWITHLFTFCSSLETVCLWGWDGRGKTMSWLPPLGTWSVVRYTTGIFICLLLFLYSIFSCHGILFWDRSHMAHPLSPKGVWISTRPGQSGHHICQVAMISSGIGSWLNLRAIIVLFEGFL